MSIAERSKNAERTTPTETASPFLTDPTIFVTWPTRIPPTELDKIGMRALNDDPLMPAELRKPPRV
ncbi:hypothetical protein C9890_0196 [Perkinsus sp. BL_2016]|nr:hypothetical protein C9890_0196 [Perkinsus sp. BL_2016]